MKNLTKKSASKRRSTSLIILDTTLVNNSATLIESPSNRDESTLITNDSSNRLHDQTVTVDHSTNIKSVKEHAKKLNRLNTESELKQHMMPLLNEAKLISKASVLPASLQQPKVDLNETASSSKFKVELESVDFSDVYFFFSFKISLIMSNH